MSDSTYLVTARKYRPLLFKEVVGQEHVTETLKNAIRLDRLAHAYLFSGPRGVGKTTVARILAKAINCTAANEDRNDGAEPCRKCVSCVSFEEGRNLNIIEIDAASNNKVDDIRELRDTVRIPPQNARMKVYIVDEVHMLTTSAFNALLKTLEEPPPHVMFIFATTEPHKVLPTIQSRCQRFDFRRISVQETMDRLRTVCEEESIQADEASLMLIARKGDGALRDALSVFDQAVSLCGTTITHAELVKALGVVDSDLFFDVTGAVSSRHAGAMLHIVDRIVRAGYDLQEFVDGLAEHLRNLIVSVSVQDPNLIEATEQDRKRISEHASQFSESTLLSLIGQVNSLAIGLRSARQPRLTLEMGLLRMASLPSTVDLKQALDKLDNLERMAASGEVRIVTEQVQVTAAPVAPAPTPVAAPAPSEAPPQAAPAPTPEPINEVRPEPAQPPVPESAPQPAQSIAEEPAPSEVAAPPELVLPEEPEPMLSGPAAPSLPPPAPGPARPATPEPPAEEPSIGDPGMSLFGDAPAIKKPLGGHQASAGAATEIGDDSDVLVLEEEVETVTIAEPGTDLSRLQVAWNEIVEEIMQHEKQLGSFLKHAALVATDRKAVVLEVPDDFHAKALRNERPKLAHRLTESSGLHIEQIGFKVKAVRNADEDAPSDETDARERLSTLCDENPAVRALVERFGGEIVW